MTIHYNPRIIAAITGAGIISLGFIVAVAVGAYAGLSWIVRIVFYVVEKKKK